VRLRGGLLYLRDAQVLTAAASPRSEVPYNALLDAGYKSIGDWHSTAPPTAATSAAGSGTATPDYFKMKRQFEKRVREEELRQADDRKDGSEPIGDLDATAPTDGGVVVDAQ
jgi:3'-phosphoadenosine 5'-phosphosulfate sulfotransferase (PAPS reductase)/FAD synthetase